MPTRVGSEPNEKDDSNQKYQVLTNQATKRLRSDGDLYFKSGRDACILSNFEQCVL